MRLLLPLLLLLVAAAPPPTGAGRAVETLSADTEARWVPFELSGGGQIRFTAMLAGQSVAAMLDTGATHSQLSRDYAAANHLRVTTIGSASAIGGIVPIGWTRMPTLAMGGLNRHGGGISVAPLPSLATGGASVDILVGRDLLDSYALDIDFPQHRFRLLPSGRQPFAGAIAPLSVDRQVAVMLTSLAVAGKLLSPMIVDTGDGSAVTVSAEAWQRLGLDVPVTSGVAYGVGGTIETGLAIVPDARLGTLRTGPVEIRIEQAAGFSQGLGAAGRIGSGFLRAYRVLLDSRAGHMVLAAGSPTIAPPVRSTSGLLLALDGDRLKVLHVMRGGPAALAGGWATGDAICSVDGTAVTADYPRQPIAIWSTDRPGRTVALGMCDGSRRRLQLERFY